ncbi:MAG: dihydropteroate synthase [PVC group bacterium]
MMEKSARASFLLEWTDRPGRGHRLSLGGETVVMGVLNLTPDSFYDGGFYPGVEAAVDRALAMEKAGAGIIDLGGESSRPGAERVTADEELRRVMPVLERLVGRLSVPVSIDTCQAAVAARALEAGAQIVNDIGALGLDPGMASVVADHSGPYVMMHMQGTPGTMQERPFYRDLWGELKEFFRERIERAASAGIDPGRIIIDPGIGFGKTPDHNLEIIAGLPALAGLGRPILVGPSRKSFIGAILDQPPAARLWGTAAAVAACVLGGAHIVRVHDVEEMKDVAAVTDRIKLAATPLI